MSPIEPINDATNDGLGADLQEIFDHHETGDAPAPVGTQPAAAPPAPAATPAPPPTQVPSAAAQPAGTAPAPMQATPAAVPVPAGQPPQPQAAGQTPQQSVQEGGQPAPTSAQPPQAPQQQPADFEAVRQRAIGEIASSFTFTPQQKEALMLSDEGAGVMAQLAAQVTVRAYENTFASIMSALPDMVRNTMMSHQANQEAWNKFFVDNPHLAQKREDVYRLAGDYRRSFPQMPGDQLLKEIAVLAGTRLGLAPVPAEAPVQTARPATTPTRPPGLPSPPAAPAGVAAPPSAPGNEMEQLFQEFMEAERRMN